MEVFWTLTTLLLVAGTSQSGPLHCLHRRTQLKGFSDHHVALPCSFNWTGTEPLEYMVVWNVAFTHQGRKTMVHGQENRKDVEQDSMFNGRTKLGEAWFVKRNASLRLRRLSPSDEGTYTCQITTMNPHSRKVCAEVALTVQKSEWNCSPNGGLQNLGQHLCRKDQGHIEEVTEPRKTPV